MPQDGWIEAIAEKSVKDHAKTGQGFLLQIHPLQISGPLVALPAGNIRTFI